MAVWVVYIIVIHTGKMVVRDIVEARKKISCIDYVYKIDSTTSALLCLKEPTFLYLLNKYNTFCLHYYTYLFVCTVVKTFNHDTSEN